MQQKLILDGGVLVNVYVSGQCTPILSAAPFPCVASTQTLAERIPLPTAALESGGWPTLATLLIEQQVPIEPVDLSGAPLATMTALTTLTALATTTDADAERLLEWAMFLPREAASLLTYIQREGLALATDDRCVRAAIQEVAPSLTTYTTADLLWRWQRSANPPEAAVQAAVSAIEAIGCYSPDGESPAARWWRQLMQPEQDEQER